MRNIKLLGLKSVCAIRSSVGLMPANFCCIRGYPKSGTNWVGNLLRLHPDIHVSGEWAFGGLTQAANERNQLYWTASHDPALKDVFEQDLRELIKRHYRLEFALNGGWRFPKWICDQSPAPVYPEVIPGSPVIYVIRNLRDVLVSRAFHLLRHDGEWGISNYPRMKNLYHRYHGKLELIDEHPQLLLSDFDWVEDIARSWSERISSDVSISITNGEFLLTSDRRGAQLHVVKYEDLHEDVEKARMKMYEFLGLDSKRAAALDTGKIKTTPGFKKENPNSFFRSGKVSGWRRYWNEEVEGLVQNASGEILKRFYS